jgi:regulator of replication initiation timing
MRNFLKKFLLLVIGLSAALVSCTATIVSFHKSIAHHNVQVVLLGTEHWKDDKQSIVQAGLLFNAAQQLRPHDHILLEDNPSYRIQPVVYKNLSEVKDFHKLFPRYPFNYPNLQDLVLNVCDAYTLCELSGMNESLIQVIEENVIPNLENLTLRNSVCPLELFLNMFEQNKLQDTAHVESIDNRIVYSHLNKILNVIQSTLLETPSCTARKAFWCSNGNDYTFADLEREWVNFFAVKVKQLRKIGFNKPDFIQQLDIIKQKSKESFSNAMSFLINSLRITPEQFLELSIKKVLLQIHEFIQNGYHARSHESRESADSFFQEWQGYLTVIGTDFSDAFANLFEVDALLRILEIEHQSNPATSIIVFAGDDHIKILKVLLGYFNYAFDEDDAIQEAEEPEDFEYLQELISAIN